MATTAFYAPAHRVLGRFPSSDAGYPPNSAPNLDFCGNGIQDHRLKYNTANSATGFGVIGFHGSSPVFCLNITPSTIATANIVALSTAAVVSGTPRTLVSVTGAGITVLASATVFWPSMTSLSAGCVIDSVPTPLAFGDTFRTGFYNRSLMCGRAVSITAGSAATGGAFTVAGYDVYGYAMSESITSVTNSTVNGKKAFKVVTSVTPAFADAGGANHGYSVGTADIFGFPIRCPIFGDAAITWNSAVITASTGFVVPDATSPATTTTGDVRGTYAVQSASDGTKTLQVKVYPSISLMATDFTTGLFGVAQG